jgi:hypothetical protein
MIELLNGYRYHEDSDKFICDDRDILENARIVRSMSDEEFEKLMIQINEIEESKKQGRI